MYEIDVNMSVKKSLEIIISFLHLATIKQKKKNQSIECGAIRVETIILFHLIILSMNMFCCTSCTLNLIEV